MVVGRDPRMSFDCMPRAFFCSMYSVALRLRGNAGSAAGISAPFCTSISAIGNGIAFPADDSGRVGDIDDDGDAGSAAASARKTECVPLDLSVTFGFAFEASA